MADTVDASDHQSSLPPSPASPAPESEGEGAPKLGQGSVSESADSAQEEPTTAPEVGGAEGSVELDGRGLSERRAVLEQARRTAVNRVAFNTQRGLSLIAGAIAFIISGAAAVGVLRIALTVSRDPADDLAQKMATMFVGFAVVLAVIEISPLLFAAARATASELDSMEPGMPALVAEAQPNRRPGARAHMRSACAALVTLLGVELFVRIIEPQRDRPDVEWVALFGGILLFAGLWWSTMLVPDRDGLAPQGGDPSRDDRGPDRRE